MAVPSQQHLTGFLLPTHLPSEVKSDSVRQDELDLHRSGHLVPHVCPVQLVSKFLRTLPKTDGRHL